MLGHDGVQVHQAVHPFGYAIGDAGDHHSPVAVADQHRVLDVLGRQHAAHVLDVCVEVHSAVQQMAAFAESGQCQRVGAVSVAA